MGSKRWGARHPWWLCLLSGALWVSGCAAGANPAPQDGGSAVDGNVVPTFDAGPILRDAGQDAGPIEQVGLCESCRVHAQCGSLGRCVPLTDGQYACAAICNPDIPSCPRGFECVMRFEAPDFPVCVPVGERCCVDEDADGYGAGVGCDGTDCDDTNIDVNPGAPELCNGQDDDCNGEIDDMPTDCGGQQCREAGESYEEVTPGDCVSGACVDGDATSCALFTCELGGSDGDRCATTCTTGGADDDGVCIVAAHCNLGVCIDDEPNGGECDEDSDCQSAHCDNGFCCDDGVCCGGSADCPGYPGVGATCDDSATCQGSRGDIVCTANQCTTNSGVADDSACGSTIEANTCGYFHSVYCDGAASQTPPACPSTCSSDDQCDVDGHCDSVCIPDVTDGGLCDEDSDCISGHCNNNVCCAGGDCCRTPSDCPSSYSTSPTCDSPTSCQGTRDAATCADYQCGTAMDVADDSACTTSIEAQTCGLYPSRFCTSGTDQMPPVCAMMCSADAECDENAHCDAMMCVADLGNGNSCDEDSDCASNHCQNGFCCGGGDCCARASDCSAAAYGEAARCLSGSTCQGERRDPICNASSQCALGPIVDDDSGCVGTLSNTCGLYPSVNCSADATQPSDQASLCAMTCSSSADCDMGAYCTGGACTPRGNPGDACTGSAQCNDGLSCVDGVCCTSSCTGSCMACNVPGNLGTCAPVPAGTDPAAECGGFSCGGYYAGWTGDQCYLRADAPASAVSCDGSGACEVAADVCPTRPQGALTLNCDDVCQSPTSGTCNGTLAGACSNAAAGSQSCGVGACRTTVARCNSGTQVTCTPGSPSAEVCDDVDNNCNGVTDDGLSGDGYEVNNACSQPANLGTLYTQAASGQPASLSIVPTLYGSGDVDVFRVDWSENDSSCGCSGFLATDEDYALTATISVPANAGSYRICAQMDGCGGTGTCTTVTGGSSGSVTIWKDGCCSPVGCHDSGTGYFTVSGVGAPGYECAAYTLGVQTVRGCRH